MYLYYTNSTPNIYMFMHSTDCIKSTIYHFYMDPGSEILFGNCQFLKTDPFSLPLSNALFTGKEINISEVRQ